MRIASPVSFQTTPDDPLETRVETVGRVQPHVRAKIVTESGELTPVGTAGELCVAGYMVQKGYWMNPEQTNAVMKQDNNDHNTLWMYTGDQAVMDREGYLKNIVEAAAIAVPDARFGEVVGAWILLRRGAAPLSRADVIDWVKIRMNPQNAPAWVWFLGGEGIPPELPKTGSGKVMKNVLREWAKAFVVKNDAS
ncbi:hypothetical protein FRC07_004587 [Ceratobasidium sp. 392]|nr:hypothetical protein FRC07_004587 [Ceratobasidium sp. 392]